MQTQSPFGPLLGLSPMLPSPAAVAAAAAAASGTQTPVSMATFPSAFAAFASQIRNTQLQSLLQSQIQALNSGQGVTPTPLARHNYNGAGQNSGGVTQYGGKVRGTTEYPLRKRVGGSTVKTAKVWRYFDELPTIEQAAECRICRKKIKATNSSTTGMIRHLRSCHVQEYQLVQEARQNSMIVKMEEKARAKLLREMNEKVMTTGIENHPIVKKEPPSSSDSQKSPSASSSASDTASSASSTHFSQLIGLPAPVPIKPLMGLGQGHNQNQSQNQNHNPLLAHIKCEATEVEEDEPAKPTDLSLKMEMMTSPVQRMSAFCAVQDNMKTNEFQKKIEDDHKIHMQIALMLLLDQQPSHLIDRPGFRSLFKFLLPDYHLPSGDIFQATIVPQLLNHMKQQIGAIFNGHSNTSGNISGAATTASSNNLAPPPSEPMTATSSYEEVSSVNESSAGPADDPEEEDMEEDVEMGEEEEEEEHVEVEDDTSSASSSVDTEACDAMASFIHFIGSDAFPHDELISLLSVVSNIFTYFSTRPHIQTHLQMTTVAPKSPPLVQQVHFVANNLSIISNYIRHTPDMQLLPLSVNQEAMLEKLVDHMEEDQ
uniref:BED-type domain-containing protein n=1 Tax=Caenorhabditis japonica TaxID=281687 RepID=A0A8R1E3P3_CAEJA